MANQSIKPVKRRIKNPETFREKSQKASVDSDKLSLYGKLKAMLGKVIKPAINLVKTVFHRLNGVQPFKFIFKLLHWLGLAIAPPYIRSSLVELKQVTWPTRPKSRQLTTAVLIFAIVFGTVVAIVDYGLDKLFRNILLK